MNRWGAVAAILLMLAHPAWAHVVMADGTVGVTMHVDPDDAPVAGKPSRFYFWFKDTTGHLDPAQCRGTFTVALGDKLVSAQALFPQISLGLISVHDVTFPHAGVYTVRVNGAPKASMTFQPFLMEFSVRVTPGDTVADGTGFGWWSEHAWHVGLGVAAGGLILWWGLRPALKRKKKK